MKSELFRVYDTDVEKQSVSSEFSDIVIAQTEPSLNTSFMRWYYASNDISENGQEVPEHTAVEATDTTISFESQRNYTGAVGFFVLSSNPVLLGHTFHVLNGSAGKITLANKLPGTPQPGDTFKLFKGGKYASNQEILAMKVSGKQPEIQRVTGPHTGVRIVKVSPLIGAGILTLEVSDGTAKIKINDGDFGNPVPVGDFIRVPVFAPDGIAHVIVDMIGTIRAGKDKFTVQPPLASFVPSFSGQETSVGKIRYHLAVLKNESEGFANNLAFWTKKPPGESTTVSDCNDNIITVLNTRTWPSRGFWIRNRTKNDLRYVDYRSGNALYTKVDSIRSNDSKQWVTGDTIEPASDIDIGIYVLREGMFCDTENDYQAPEGVNFIHATNDKPLVWNSLGINEMVGVWTREVIRTGHVTSELLQNNILLNWE